MESFSDSMLLWTFGKWIFGGSTLPPELAGTPEVTPLIIFGSLFATAGIAMVGILGAWAIFIGIFRLRNNGNFFGAQNSNEAFFYPIRLVAAMALCAPVVNVASAGGQAITLTPGHSLIAGIAKTGSGAGDSVQGHSFRLMHIFNMFKEPDFKIDVNDEQLRAQIASWYSVAIQIEASRRSENPFDSHKSTSAGDFSQLLIEAKWRLVYPVGAMALAGTSDEYAKRIAEKFELPLIPPNDEMARKGAFGAATQHVSSEVVDATADADMETEGLFCRWGAGTFCSDEYKAVHKQNDEAIHVGKASAQRTVFSGLIAAAHGYLAALSGPTDSPGSVGLNSTEMEAHNEEQKRYIIELANWYKNTITATVQNKIASEHVASAEAFHSEMQSWGWMAGSSFVLRAAADFSRLQSYAEGATSALLPKTELADLTGSDSLTKMVHEGAIKNVSQAQGVNDKTILQKFFSVDFLQNPETLNMSSVTSWGRALAGTGIGIVGGSYLAGFISKVSVLKPLGALDNTVVKSIGFALIIVGGLIGYILPLMFVIYGVFGVISWLTFVMSAFYGVTLWAAAQAAPKGEEHSSQMAAKGWNILVFIGLYPMLAAGGLAAAIVITNVGLPFVGIMMGGVFGMFDPGTAEVGRPLESLAGILIGGLVTVIVFAILCWSVCVTAAQLITNFPRTVLNMISIGEPALNPYENVSQGVASSVGGTLQRAVVGTATGHITKGISRIVGGRGRDIGTKATGA